MKIKSWSNLNIGDFYKLKGGDKVIVVDITQKPWAKQFGTVSEQDNNIINGVTDIYKRYLVHCRCKSIVELNMNSINCKKCGYIIPNKDICFKSVSTYRYIRNKPIIIGESLIKNEDKIFILLDLDYDKRKDKIRKIQK